MVPSKVASEVEHRLSAQWTELTKLIHVCSERLGAATTFIC